jgi:hypothetical protein
MTALAHGSQYGMKMNGCGPYRAVAIFILGVQLAAVS